jgi:hypothetical protein
MITGGTHCVTVRACWICDSDGGTIMSSNLVGTGYGWLHVWQDGFSGDNLGIDSMRGRRA